VGCVQVPLQVADHAFYSESSSKIKYVATNL
jgi:hypothetical protein